MFDPAYPVARLKPAAYNPRAITPDALEHLQASIRQVGFCKPVIVTDTGTIVAGHQRTKAATALGLSTVPAYVLTNLSTADEVRFNQLHNGTDLDEAEGEVRVPAGPTGVFTLETALQGSTIGIGAAVRNETSRLLLLYGNWGGAVAREDGLVLSGQQYVLACKLLSLPARIYRVPAAAAPAARQAFARRYGVFSYDHLPRATYIQSFAQMYRLRETASGKQNASSLYTKHVAPWLKKHPGARLLDFGCGQGDYARHLRGLTGALVPYEPFFRSGQSLDRTAVHRMIDGLVAALRDGGLFDAVVCDSVLNSVDSPEAEDDVLRCVTALTRPGGTVFLSGRRRERVETQLTFRTNAPRKQQTRLVEFLDADGFSALYRGGAWFFQKFHSEAQITALVRRYVSPGPFAYTYSSTSWQIAAPREVPVEAAAVEASLGREFNLPWPNGERIGRGADVLAAYRAAVSST